MQSVINNWQVFLLPIEGDTERATLQVFHHGQPAGQVILQTDHGRIGSIIAEPVKA